MSHIFKNTVKRLGPFIAVFILGIALFELLPLFVQAIVNRALAGNDPPVALTVRSIGLLGSDLSKVSIGADNKFVQVDSLRVDYSPASLLQKKLHSVTLSGIVLNLQFEDGRLVLPWAGLTEHAPTESGSGNLADQLASLSGIGEINIHQGLINISSADLFYAIPASFNAKINNANPRLIDMRIELILRGEKLITTAEINLDTMEMQTATLVDSLELKRFADLLKASGLNVSGSLNMKAETRLNLQLLTLVAARVHGRLSKTDIAIKQLHLTNINTPEETPFQFNLTADGNTYRFTSNALALDNLVAAEIGDLDFSIAKQEDGYSGSGAFSVKVAAQQTAAALVIAPLELVTRIDGSSSPNGVWRVHAAAANKNALEISGPKLQLTAEISGYNLSATGGNGRTRLNYMVNLSSLNIAADTLTARLPEVTAAGETLNGITAVTLPLKNYSLTESNTKLNTAVSGEIAMTLPFQSNGKESELRAEKISWAGKDLGSLNLTVKQEPQGFKISGRYQSALIDNFCIDLAGQADFSKAAPDAELRLHNSCATTFNNIDLGDLAPDLSGLYADAGVNLNGLFSYKDGTVSGTLDTRLENIRLQYLIKGFNLTGGALDIHFQDLPKIKTAAKQTLSFQAVNLGKMTAANGLVEFQIESPESIFIEKGRMDWSDGRVYTQALRFSPKIKDYDLIFYCDRLHFAKLLEQLGVATAEGRGRVSGRVPVRITDGNFFLENGFLYSSPGEGGKIKLTETEMLTAGIPQDTPQFAQIDLAREALKDFSYDWTRLEINSVSPEDLLLNLKINGKPSQPLPFVYNKEFGGFARVDATSPGSRFQGIQLDVNFRLPLNEVLHYGDSIKSIMK